MVRRIASRLVYILTGCVFLSFILNRLYNHSNVDGVDSSATTGYQLMARKQLVKFDDNMPSSCDRLPRIKTHSFTISVIISMDTVSSPMLAQTVSSVIAYTEPSLLQEIIITSSRNMSAADVTRGQSLLSQYGSLVRVRPALSTNKLSNKLLVSNKYASGSVMMYIDDTVVVSENFLTPLLQLLSSKPRAIAVPSTNYIKSKGDGFQPDSPHVEHKWIFDWHLNHPVPFEMDFIELVTRSEIDLYPTPAFNGAAFAINKSYLSELASSARGLLFLNDIDLSFTLWLCGDGVYITSCSRVGQTTHQSSTIVPKEVELSGRHQMAMLYLTDDGYRYAFDVVNKEAGHIIPEEEKLRTERYATALRKCPHSFTWFMHHIVKGDVYVPTSDVRAYGQFITSRGGVFSQDPAMVFLLTYGPFSYAKKGATIEYLKTGQLRIGSFCLVLSDKGYVVADVCNYGKPIYKWIWTSMKQFKVTVNGEDRCISHATDPYPESNKRQVLMYTVCASSESDARFQTWDSFVWL